MIEETAAILRYIKQAHRPRATDILNQFGNPGETQSFLELLLHQGYLRKVEGIRLPDCYLDLTPYGLLALLGYEKDQARLEAARKDAEAARENAEAAQKTAEAAIRQSRTSNWIAAVSAAIVLLHWLTSVF